MAIALDGSTPAAVDSTASTSGTATTASFSPPAGSLVVIAVNILFKNTTATGPAVTCADSASTSYAAGPSPAYDGQFDGSYIFSHYYGTAPGSVTVTVTRTAQTGQALFELVPYVLTGASSSQSGAASASATSTATTTSITGSITTTTANSWTIVAAGLGASRAFTASGLTSDHTHQDSTDLVTGGAGHAVTGTPGAVTLGWTISPSSSDYSWAALEILPSTTHSGTATLSGTGTLSAAGALAGAAALSGSGTLAWSGSRILRATVLSGSGTLTGQPIGTISAAAALSGAGTLSGSGTGALLGAAALSGAGTLAVPGYVLGPSAVLAGTGTLSIIGTGGTVAATAGASSPYAWPGTSQVAVAPPGTAAWQYLGTLGLVTSLTYSFMFPGGADKLTCTVMIPASYRTQLQTPGWQVRVTRGGHVVWTGRMDEPVPTASGWQFTAVGDGQRGRDFRAWYTSAWPSGEPDQAVNNAIARGLPWVNPGIGSPSGIWLGQAQDPASATIADLLNLACTRGGLAWYANSQPGGQPGTNLAVFPLPAAVNRLLVVTEPAPRTLGGDINTIWLRYQATADDPSGTGAAASYATTSVQNAASVAAHGVTETYIDLSSAGVMSAGAAQAVGNSVLANYQRASFAGPYTASHGQLLNTGGAAVDPGTDQAGTVIRPILVDYAYGGEVAPGSPLTFITGGYEWDDFAGKATITPYQTLDQSLPGLLSMETAVLTPITTQQ